MMRLLEKTLGGTVMTSSQVLRLMFPLLLDQIFLRVITVVSTAMISYYRPEAMAAVSLVNSVNFFITALFTAVATGCTVVVAQYCGRRDYRKARTTVAQSLTTSTALSIIIAVSVLVFLNPMVRLLFGEGDPLLLYYCRIFLAGSAISYPFFAISQTILGALRGEGKMKASFYFTTAQNGLNLLLNIIFLRFFTLGVMGLAISIVVSRMVVCGIMLVYLFRTSKEYPYELKEFFRIIKAIQRSVFLIALPIMLEAVFFNGGRLITQTMIVSLGTMSLAANAYTLNVTMIITVIGDVMLIAIVTIVGQCIGAGDVQEAKRYAKRLTVLAVLGSWLLSGILAIMLPSFMGLFNLPPEAYDIALRISWLFIIFAPIVWPASFVIPNALRGAGDALYTSVVALVLLWIFRIAVVYVLIIVFDFSLMSVMITMLSEWGVRSIIFMNRLRGDKWYRHKVI